MPKRPVQQGPKDDRVQTAFRFSPELLARAKRRARDLHMSLNSYVEMLLKRDTELKFPTLPKDFKVSEDLRALTRGIKMDPRYLSKDPQEQIRLDDQAKYEYLAEKYGIK